MLNTTALLAGLNDKQIQAVLHTEGPLLIIAGAGSGKTRVMTHRIAYLIQERGVSPWNVLGVTFTNKAAHEIKARVAKLVYGDQFIPEGTTAIPYELNQRLSSQLPHLGTFHSMCVRILRKHAHLLGYENNFVIYDDADQLGLMKVLLGEMRIDEKMCNPRAVLSHISGAKNELVSPEAYRKMVHGGFFADKVAAIYAEYQKRLQQNRAFDFDDLLMKTVELFQRYRDVLSYFQQLFSYILVDEYQDTNHAQYVMVKLLAESHKNVCVVGDSDQSIYSWRGADIRNILDFEKDYPDAKVIKLEQNYRSTKTILEAAHQVIVKNKKRKEKKLWTDRDQGSKIHVITARDEREEGEFIVHHVRKKIEGYEYPVFNDFALLYRTNVQSRVLEEVFLRHGMPYKIVGGVRFYDRKEIKDVLAYLKILLNPHDEISLMRIINTPPRQIGQKTLSHVQTMASRDGISHFEALQRFRELDLSDTKSKTIEGFLALVSDLRKANNEFPASGVISYALQLTGYQDFLLADGSEEGEERMDNVRELMSVAGKYDQLEPGISLSTFLEEVALVSDIDMLSETHNAVTFMTLHAAKGLEFPCVFICGLEEGIFPHSRSMLEPDALEEERRLMYVGMTRAKDELYLLHAQQRLLYGESRYNAPSQFMNDISEDLLVHFPEKSRALVKEEIGTSPIPTEEVYETVTYSEGEKATIYFL